MATLSALGLILSNLKLVVDPNGETVTRAAPEGSPTTLRGDDRIDLGPVLPDFELTVRDLFATLHLV